MEYKREHREPQKNSCPPIPCKTGERFSKELGIQVTENTELWLL